MAQSLRVKVLEAFSPSKFSVRPVQWEGRFHDLQNRLDFHYVRAGERESVAVADGDSVCICYNGHWCRGVVASSSEDKLQLKLRLVDVGKFVYVATEDVQTNIPAHLLADAGLSLWCHLDGVLLADVVLSSSIMAEVKEELPEDRIVDLVRRGGGPVQVDGGHYSLPVDLTWTTTIIPGPQLPSRSTSHSLTEKVLHKMGGQTTLDISSSLLGPSDDDQPDQEEFANVSPLENAVNFSWLPPELPRKKVFSAVGTFVDQSGQIFVQFTSKRQSVRPVEVVKQLLNEKFRNISRDEGRGTLQQGQSCCVLWRDDNWYRAIVVNISQDREAMVYLVDFGNFYQAKLENIRPEIFAQRIPVQALKLQLAGLRPLGPGYTWTETALEFIMQNIEHKKIRVEVVDKTRRPPSVNISVSGVSADRFDLGQMLSRLEGDLVELDPDYTASESLRAEMDQGIEAVSAGTYQEKNPFLLLQSVKEEEEEEEPAGRDVTFPDWAKSGLLSGDKLRVKIVDIFNFKTLFLHPNDPSCQYLVDNFAEHQAVFTQFQRSCDNMPPVFQPRAGLLVAAQYRDENNCKGWYRAKIRGFDDKEVVVYFIDYGTTSTISDSMMIKKIPTEFGNLPVLAIKLELAVESQEEEEDIASSLMMEEIYTEERDVVVRIFSLGEAGTIRGHLEVEETGELVYRNLLREGVLQLVL